MKLIIISKESKFYKIDMDTKQQLSDNALKMNNSAKVIQKGFPSCGEL